MSYKQLQMHIKRVKEIKQRHTYIPNEKPFVLSLTRKSLIKPHSNQGNRISAQRKDAIQAGLDAALLSKKD